MNKLEDKILENLDCPDVLGSLLFEYFHSDSIAEDIESKFCRLADGDRSAAGALAPNCLTLMGRSEFRLFLIKIANQTPESHQLGLTRANICTEASNTVFVAKSSEPLWLETYEPCGEIVNAVFERGVAFRLADRSEYDGRTVFGDAHSNVAFRWKSEGTAFALKLVYRPFLTQSWFVDQEKLVSVYAAAFDPIASGLALIAKAFGEMQDDSSLPFLRSLFDRPEHFLRWTALQAVGRIDGEMARDMLDAACRDEHPHIRQAASAILERLG